MGFSFRKSYTFGPLRVNLSKSGVGFSFGVKGLRAGYSANGRKYVSAGVPGTGARYYKSTKSLSGLWNEWFGGEEEEAPQKKPAKQLKKKESFW
ncbi:hypothetical protein Pan97_08760 [Bremerella volcania]|uniref:DUF4236 domain-containing protein n=1 Tax=Bremerella volcania TaxID=2527984 RepID=A0A518C3S2_9BACT|nr:DUF4236 domain-containing protein [Bremerella volcania]QDU73876.1 hypothetical protein Pan97_08760 [Bremerella volcania]